MKVTNHLKRHVDQTYVHQVDGSLRHLVQPLPRDVVGSETVERDLVLPELAIEVLNHECAGLVSGVILECNLRICTRSMGG